MKLWRKHLVTGVPILTAEGSRDMERRFRKALEAITNKDGSGEVKEPLPSEHD